MFLLYIIYNLCIIDVQPCLKCINIVFLCIITSFLKKKLCCVNYVLKCLMKILIINSFFSWLIFTYWKKDVLSMLHKSVNNSDIQNALKTKKRNKSTTGKTDGKYVLLNVIHALQRQPQNMHRDNINKTLTARKTKCRSCSFFAHTKANILSEKNTGFIVRI